MKWVWIWLVGPVVAFLVIAVGVHFGQRGSGAWPYLVPLLIAGVASGVFCAALAMNVVRHQRRGDPA